jgi:Flp pilus assembly pilin Flp
MGITSRRRARGAASTEYILLIGLVVLFIIVGLIVWRDSVNDFISKVAAWIEGSAVPETTPVAMAAPPPPPPPAATPTPTPAPEDWPGWLEGRWCSDDGVNDVLYSRAGPGMINVTRVYPDGRRAPTQHVTITGQGQNGYRETLPGNANWFSSHRRINDNTFQIVSTADGASGAVFRRC